MAGIITFTEKGDFKNTERYLSRLSRADLTSVLNKYGTLGVNALSNATPIESGETAGSWYHTVEHARGYSSIRWHNTHIVDGVPIAVIIQYGHGTGTGGYVQGQDYINPAIKPIFEQIAAEAWKEVTKV